MEGCRIAVNPIYLKIGDWNIKIENKSKNLVDYFIPFKASAFSIQRPDKIDFSLDIKIDNLYKKPSTIYVDGFDDSPYSYSIYKDELGEYTWINNNIVGNSELVYKISKEWDKWSIIQDNSDDKGLKAFSRLGNIFSYSALQFGGIVLHGVIMEWNGKGILVCAKSGVGKTTHTRMWRESENALIINGDRALCRKIGDKWYAYGSPWCGSSGEYINRKVKINAIVILERGTENSVYSLDLFNSTMNLIKRVFAPKWDKDIVNKSFDIIDDIVNNIPVYCLKCRPDLESVEVLREVINKL